MDPKDGGARPPEATDAAAALHPIEIALQGLRDPVVVILLLAGFFDSISGNPIHGVVLGTVALALAFDGERNVEMARPGGPGMAALRTAWGRALLIGVAALYAVSGGTFGRYSWQATLAILLPGFTALTLAWRGPLPGAPKPGRPKRRAVLPWAAVFVALALWELAALLMQPTLTTDSYAHPTISVLSDPALATHPGRSVIMFAWLCVGGYLVRR